MRSLAWIVLVATAACGSGSGGDGDAGPGEGRYLPLAQGNSWTYLVTDPMTMMTENKTSTVEAFEAVPNKAGVMAFRVRTEKLDGETVSWQEDTGDSIIRHEEQTFDPAGTMTRDEVYEPYKLRLDEARLTPGTTYQESYTETELIGGTPPVAKTEEWTIGNQESVTVPDGTFQALRVDRTTVGVPGTGKSYWFARGVGKVRESGGQTEELTAHTVAP